jgi:hypothetical protein
MDIHFGCLLLSYSLCLDTFSLWIILRIVRRHMRESKHLGVTHSLPQFGGNWTSSINTIACMFSPLISLFTPTNTFDTHLAVRAHHQPRYSLLASTSNHHEPVGILPMPFIAHRVSTDAIHIFANLDTCFCVHAARASSENSLRHSSHIAAALLHCLLGASPKTLLNH